MVFSVSIVGAGNIAGGYDAPGSPQILTHLHAINSESRFICHGLFDRDIEQSRKMASKWQVPVFEKFDDLVAQGSDIVVVAVPDQYHAEYLISLLDHRATLVLCEKPLTDDMELSRAIASRYRLAGKKLIVNYQRRYEPSVRQLKIAVSMGELGRPLSGAVWYSKGVRHNGSHAVDLLRFLFGDVQAVMSRRKVYDFTPTDPSVAGTIRFADVDIELHVGDERLFSIFEVDLLFEKGRFRYSQSGMHLESFEVMADPLFPGYFEQLPVSSGSTGLSRALLSAYQAIGDFLENGAPLPLTVEDAVETQAVCEILAKQPLDSWQVFDQP